MSKRLWCSLVCAALMTSYLGNAIYSGAVAQESKKSEVKAEAGSQKGAKKKASTGDRLPPNFGKIGLSDEQRQKIYGIQNKYEAEIQTLQKQIADLKAKQNSEIEAVLTDAQKKSLHDANDESKKKAAEKKKADAKPSEKSAEKTEK